MHLKTLTRLAEEGDPASALACGVLAELDPSSDSGGKSEAERWYQVAAETLPVAQYALAKLMVEDGRRIREGLALAEKAANSGIAQAASLLSLYFEHGPDELKDHDKATSWLKTAADLGDPWAWGQLASPDGEGISSDPATEEPLLKEALKQGYHPAAAKLATIFFEHSDPPRVEDGMKLLQHAAAQHEDWAALFQLASIHRHGLYGQEKDDELAGEYSKRASEVQTESTKIWS